MRSLVVSLLLVRQMVMPIGFGLEPKTAKAYKQEWQLYLGFCARRGIAAVPGRDVEWRFDVVQAYLDWRSNRVQARGLMTVKSKLKHCGLCHDFLLPAAKGEEPSKLRLQLASVHRHIEKRQKKALKAAGKSADPKRALALGHVAVGLLFSAFGATTEAGFAALQPTTRCWLAVCAAMHTGCMRFKLLKKLCKRGALRWSQADRTYRLASDWRKMKRRGSFTVPFPMRPDFDSMWYSGYTQTGEETGRFTAAHVFRWYTRARGSSAGNIFAAMGKAKLSRRSFQAWLRGAFGSLLVGNAREIQALVEAITPHSFRAGMASDLERERIPRLHIKRVGRWSSDRAMEQYARDGLAQRLQRLTYSRIIAKQSALQRLAWQARPGKRARSSDEEFGSSDEDARQL